MNGATRIVLATPLTSVTPGAFGAEAARANSNRPIRN